MRSKVPIQMISPRSIRYVSQRSSSQFVDGSRPMTRDQSTKLCGHRPGPLGRDRPRRLSKHLSNDSMFRVLTVKEHCAPRPQLLRYAFRCSPDTGLPSRRSSSRCEASGKVNTILSHPFAQYSAVMPGSCHSPHNGAVCVRTESWNLVAAPKLPSETQ